MRDVEQLAARVARGEALEANPVTKREKAAELRASRSELKVV